MVRGDAMLDILFRPAAMPVNLGRSRFLKAGLLDALLLWHLLDLTCL